MDRYQLYESIGQSTHSVVYKAREKKTIRFVAVRSGKRWCMGSGS